MIPVYSSWLSAHGKLWYDDRYYRLAWIIWPQALAAVLMLFFWAMPPSVKNVPWAKPVDTAARLRQLQTLRDTAKSNQQAMDTLELDARGGEPLAQFFYATLFDADLKLSTLVQPDTGKAVDWYGRAAAQGDEWSLSNLAIIYFNGTHVRQDYTRACFYSRKIGANAFPAGLRVKGDCYARGLGGTPVDMAQAVSAYEAAYNKGNIRAGAALGYFYENGLGGKARNAETALKFYRAAADKGDALGLHDLGAAYNSGMLGLQPTIGTSLIMPSFVAIIVGGLGSLLGTLLGGLLIGVASGLAAVYFPSATEAVIYVMMGLVLLIRPRGLLGEEGRLH